MISFRQKKKKQEVAAPQQSDQNNPYLQYLPIKEEQLQVQSQDSSIQNINLQSEQIIIESDQKCYLLEAKKQENSLEIIQTNINDKQIFEEVPDEILLIELRKNLISQKYQNQLNFKKIHEPLILSMGIEEYKEKIWDQDAIFSTKTFSTLMNYQQIEEIKWSNSFNIDSENIVKQVVPVKGVPFCKQTRCVRTSIVKEYQIGKSLIIEVKSKTIDAPYSDSFICEELWVALSSSQSVHQCVFQRFMNVNFLKQTMMKAQIIKAAEKGIIEVSEKWFQQAVQKLNIKSHIANSNSNSITKYLKIQQEQIFQQENQNLFKDEEQSPLLLNSEQFEQNYQIDDQILNEQTKQNENRENVLDLQINQNQQKLSLDKMIEIANGSLIINYKILISVGIGLNQAFLILYALPFLLKIPQFKCFHSSSSEITEIQDLECIPKNFCGKNDIQTQIQYSSVSFENWISYFNLECQDIQFNQNISYLLLTGFALGSMIIAPMFDKFGRKNSFLVSLLTISIMNIFIVFFTQSINHVYIYIFMYAIVLSIVVVQGFTYMVQLQQSKYQLINLSCALILASAMNFIVYTYFSVFWHNWKIIFIINIISLLIISSYLNDFPESYSFLYENQRFQELTFNLRILQDSNQDRNQEENYNDNYNQRFENDQGLLDTSADQIQDPSSKYTNIFCFSLLWICLSYNICTMHNEFKKQQSNLFQNLIYSSISDIIAFTFGIIVYQYMGLKRSLLRFLGVSLLGTIVLFEFNIYQKEKNKNLIQLFILISKGGSVSGMIQILVACIQEYKGKLTSIYIGQFMSISSIILILQPMMNWVDLQWFNYLLHILLGIISCIASQYVSIQYRDPLKIKSKKRNKNDQILKIPE